MDIDWDVSCFAVQNVYAHLVTRPEIALIPHNLVAPYKLGNTGLVGIDILFSFNEHLTEYYVTGTPSPVVWDSSSEQRE